MPRTSATMLCPSFASVESWVESGAGAEVGRRGRVMCRGRRRGGRGVLHYDMKVFASRTENEWRRGSGGRLHLHNTTEGYYPRVILPTTLPPTSVQRRVEKL